MTITIEFKASIITVKSFIIAIFDAATALIMTDCVDIIIIIKIVVAINDDDVNVITVIIIDFCSLLNKSLNLCFNIILQRLSKKLTLSFLFLNFLHCIKCNFGKF